MENLRQIEKWFSNNFEFNLPCLQGGERSESMSSQDDSRQGANNYFLVTSCSLECNFLLVLGLTGI